MFKDSVIVSAKRTAIGSFGGSLKDKTTIDLGVSAVKGAIEAANIDPKVVEEVVLGCCGQFGVTSFLGRIVGVKAGLAEESTGFTVNRLCASGLQAIVTASMMVENRDVEVAVAGGAESMSNYPYMLNNSRFGMRMGVSPTALEDALTTALCEPFTGPSLHIGITAENIAAKYGLTRERLDEYAFDTQERALKALEEGKFKDEIVPLEIKVKRETVIFDTDEHPKKTSVEKLSKLRPFVKADGVVTAGNASGINDAAAACIVMTKEKAKELGCTPIARVVDYAIAGVDKDYMGLGPVPATEKLLKKTGIKKEEIGLVELNEAFAAQAIACIEDLGFDPAIVNVNGSGIALGHPIGATGAVVSVKLIHEMKRRGVKYGIATLCIGGGQGLSVLFESL